MKLNNIDLHNRFSEIYTEKIQQWPRKETKRRHYFLSTQTSQDMIATLNILLTIVHGNTKHRGHGFRSHELKKIIYTARHQQ